MGNLLSQRGVRTGSRSGNPSCSRSGRGLALALGLWLFAGSCAAERPRQWTFFHNGQESAQDQRYAYHWTVLEAALEATRPRYGGYTLQSVDYMSEPRQVAELASGKGLVNTVVLDSTAELERDLLPVKIPVDKGLLGYRVFLIRAQDQARFSQVKTLDDLRRFSIGQGNDWSDVAIYRKGGFGVVTSSTYQGLFDMLMAGRFDALGRGVSEVTDELVVQQPRHPSMVVEQEVLLYYPLPVYFWFSKTETGRRYAQRVQEGMQTISANGTLDRLFKRKFGPLIQSLGLKDRVLLRLPNPGLPPDQPFSVQRYWFDPLR